MRCIFALLYSTKRTELRNQVPSDFNKVGRKNLSKEPSGGNILRIKDRRHPVATTRLLLKQSYNKNDLV